MKKIYFILITCYLINISPSVFSQSTVGNYVWEDINANGIQDEPASSGLNNVTVEIYQPVGSTPDSLNDIFIGSVITADDGSGNPGYYELPGLPNGAYYLVFRNPGGDFIVSLQSNPNTTPNLDSDGASTLKGPEIIGVTAIFNLVGSSSNLNIDQGFHHPCYAPITASASSDSPVCENSTLHLLGGTSGGTIFSWTGPNGFSSSVQNPSIANVSNLAAGVYTLTVTDGTACSATATTNVNISPSAAAPIFASGSTSTHCQGVSAVVYSATAANTTGITYSLDATSLTFGNSINASTGEVTYLAGWSGTSIITASAAGCNGPVSSIHTATITPTVGTPIFSAGSTSSRCQSASSVTYAATATNSTGIVYSLDATSITAGNSINSSTGQVTYVAGWVGTSTITATAAGCNGPTSSTHEVTTTPSVGTPVFTSGASSTRCQGAGSLTYGATATNTTGITYTLNAASLTAGNTINASTGEVTYVAGWSGTSIITASAAGCNGPRTATHTVTITPTVGTPVFASGATSTRCQAAGTVTYTATASNSTSISYALDAASITAGNTINSSTGAVTFVAGFTGTSTITATAQGCNGPSTSNHTVTTTTTVGTPVFDAGSTSSRCQGAGSITYGASATNSTSITYSLNSASLLAGNTINSTTGRVTYTALWVGTSTITATANGCNGPTTATHTVSISPSVGTPVFAMGSSSSRCQGATSVTYNATATNTTGIVYSLDASSLSGGNIINSSTGEVTYAPTWFGTSVITATASGCNGPRTANHTVTTTASVGTPVFSLGATSTRCQTNGNVTYTATASNSVSITYTLDAASLSAGNTINASNGRVNYASGWIGESTITATATGCNSTSQATHIATSTASITTPIFNNGATSTRCQGAATVNYSATSTNATGMVYSLNAASLSGGNTINSSTGDVTFTAGWTGTSIITATASGCNGPLSSTHTVTITPSVGTPVFALGLSSNRCQSAASITYTATASNNTGITYSLDVNSILGGNTINSVTGEVTYSNTWFGTSQITATATGCNGPKSTTHTVTTAQPVQTPIFGGGSTSVRCQGSGIVNYGATALYSTSIVYTLDATSAAAGNTINSTNGNVNFVAGWSGNSTVTATANGCFGPLTATHVITTTPTVGNPVFALGSSSSRCIGAANQTYSATASNNTGLTYTLDNNSLTAGNTINSATGEVSFQAGWFGVSTITVTATGCNGPKTANHTVTTSQAVLTPVFTLGNNSVRCQGAGTTTYSASAANSTGIIYSLDGTSILGGNTINASTGAVTFVAGWTGTSTVTATASGCFGPTQTSHTIVTTPSVTTPVFDFGASSVRCQGTNVITYNATASYQTSLTYSLDPISLAGGNTIDANTGTVTFSNGWNGTTRVTAVATGCSGPKSAIHTITVTPTVGLPIFTLGANSVRCQGANTITYTATSTNSTGITYALDATSLAFGNSINTATGAVTFLATWTGTSTITATATGCNGPRSSNHNISTIYIAAVADNAIGLQGTPVIIKVLDNDLGDKDPTKVTIVSQPTNGFIQIGTNGEITYLPNGNFYGLDQFTYSVCSSGSSFCCSQATVTIQIDESLNDPCSEATKSKIYYLPFPENTNLLRKSLWSAGNVSYLTDSVRTVLSIKIPYPGNILTYDHWEDGFETDITIPTQTSTEVWGDGILNNGWAPGYPTDIIPAGGYILIDNHFRYNPRNTAEIFFDGKDKILSSNDIAISKISGDAGYATGSNNFDVQNVKTNVFDLTRFGKFFIIPFGEDNNLGGTSAFKYTGIFARASQNGTIINLDYDADGLVDISSPSLNEGEVWFYDGTASTPGVATNTNNANDIKSGAILTSANNFGVDVVFGGLDSYGTRNMALLPGNFYGDVYYSPAHTTLASAPVYAFFTNNLASPITIDWNSGAGNSGSFVINAKSYSYLDLNNLAAYKFKSRNGEAFTAVAVFDADAAGSSYDWSFNMIPENRLSTFASVAWAPGSSNLSGNYSPVWVTAPTATTLYIKYDGNLANESATRSPCGMPYDVAVPISALQSYKILDPDNDQTGLAVFTCDGTKIAAIWGQDPNGAPGGSPSMDVGYIMEPRCLQQLIIANDDISDTEPNTPVIIDIQSNDYGFLCTPNPNSVSTLGLLQPSNGTVVINPDGSVTYTPNNGFQGTDTFEYRLCSVEYPGICDIALVKVRISTCIANSNENLFRGKVFVESLPDDAAYNGEMGAKGVQVDLYIDANCNGVIDPGEGITESTISDISGKFSFSTKDGNNARDDFDPTASFSGNDGGLNWNNNWSEVGDDANFTTGDVRIIPDAAVSGMGNAIRLSGATNEINRSLSFNNTISAVLKFSYRREGLDRQGEGVNVVLNGSTIFTLNDGLAVGTDPSYTNVYLPITAYNANGVNTLRFITNGSVSSDDYFWIDNIELSFYKNPPVCYVAKVNTSNTNGAYTPSLLQTETATFNLLGVCDKDNNLGVLPNLVASDDNAFTSIDKFVNINVLTNDVVGKPDSSTVTFSGTSVSPSNGTVSINPNGSIIYTPNQGFTGTDQFEYRVCSLEDPSICDIALVNVTVSCASSPLVNEISGTVYVDNNNNGVFNIGENGLNNTVVNLIFDTNKNGLLDIGEPVIDTKTTDINGYYSFVINPLTNNLNYLDQFNFSTVANQSNGSSVWATSWTKIGDTGGFDQNNIQISNITGLRIQSTASFVSGAYRSMNLSNALSANLTLDYNEQNLDLQVNDYVDLQIANSSTPSNWTLLKRFTGADGNQNGSMTFDISSFISPTTTIRFVTSGSSLMIPGDLVYFDNINVAYLYPQANKYIAQLAQPIPVGYSLTNPSPSPTGYYSASFTAGGQGTCGNNFGLAVTDLEVSKTVDIQNPYVGDTVTFSVVARNLGPTNASNVVVTDVLPTGYELINVNTTKGTWVGANWNLGNLNNGDTETLLIIAKVVAPGGYMNTATIGGDQPETNMLNNQSSATPTPIPIIDLSLTNQVSDIRPNVGDVVTFTINLANADLSPASNIQVQNIIPNGYTGISNISNGGILVGNTITWNLAGLLNNVDQNLTYTAVVLPPLVGNNYTTVAQVTAATEQDVDSTPNNSMAAEDDQANATLSPLQADLSLTNQINNVLPNTGEVVTFTVTLTNNGPDPATNVAVANLIDNGFTSITNISDGGVLVGSTIVWNLANLNSGASKTFTYQTTVLGPGPGVSHTNVAQVSAADQWDPDSSPNNNMATEDDQANATATLQGANLSLTKQINDTTPNVGDIVTFTVTLHNAGPDAATNVGIEDIVPNGYANVSSINNGGILTGNTINWNVANIANGANLIFTYQARVNAPTAGINFTNVAQITASDQFDPNSVPNNDNPLEDDQAAVSSVPKRANLTLQKTANNLKPQVGEQVTFTITVNNMGPDKAHNVELQDVVPNGYGTIVNISGSGVLTGNTISWNIPSLLNGGSQTFTYQASVQEPNLGILFTNIAQITKADEYDPTSTPNNSNSLEDDQSQVTLTPRVANLSLNKQINNFNPLAGEVVTFTLTLQNAGPDSAHNVSVVDLIPNGYTNITNISSGGTIVGNTLTWTLTDLSSGETQSLTYQATVLQPALGISHRNIAQVSGSDEFDPNSTPNNSLATEDDQDEVTAVPKQANLNLTKSVNDLTPNPEEVVTFTITVQNAGPDAATNVVIQDAIPNGYRNITNVTGLGTIVGNNLEWNIANLANGASQVFTYQATVNAPTVGLNFTNIAQVMAQDQYDSNSTPGNNVVGEDDQSQVTTTPNVANLSLIKTVSNPKPNVGDTITFTLTLNNAGPNNATNVSIEDITPNGYASIHSVSHAGTVSGNTVNWTTLNLANGASELLSYKVVVKAPLVGVNYVNTAQVTASDQYDPNSTPSNDNSSEDDQSSVSTVPQVANLMLTKAINSPNPIVGEIVTFTISVNNAGPDSAKNVVIEDALPNGYGNISNISNGGLISNDTINWSVTNIIAGGGITFSYQAEVLPPLFGVNYRNVAQVKAVDQFDPNSTPDNDNPIEDDQDEVTANVDSTTPTVVAGNDFTKTCIINTSGQQIGESPQANHSYSWSPSAGLNFANISNPIANPLVTTTYVVTKTNLANGFTATASVTVTVETSVPVANAGPDILKTCVSNASGAAIGEPNDVSSTYRWLPSIGLSDSLVANPLANPAITTTYIVTKTHIASGCFDRDTMNFVVDTVIPTVSITGNDTLTCALTTVTRTASGGVSYAWSNGLGNNATANISAPGTYIVAVTAANGCITNDTTVVSQNITAPTVSIAGNDTLTCALTTVTRTASGGVSYAWSNGLGNNATANISAPGTYIVAVTAANGCVTNDTTVVNQDGLLPNITFSAIDTLTCAATSIAVSASGGVSYAWSDGLGNNPTATISNPGIYSVTVTGSNGCSSIGTVEVLEDLTPPAVTIVGTDTISVSQANVIRIAQGGISYTWSNSLGTNDSVSISTPGIYTVTATGTNGCTATAITTVIEVRFGSISGLAWADNDKDGLREISETLSANEIVYLYDGSSNTLLDSTFTDSNGLYRFDSLNSGNFKVRFKIPISAMVSPSNMTLDSLDSDFNTSAWSETIAIDVSKDISDTLRTSRHNDIGFANYGYISGEIFNDADYSNTQTLGDPALAGIRVYLTNVSNIRIDSTLSDALGQYRFDSLLHGDYKVEIVKPIGTHTNLKDFGSDETKDSDIDPLTGRTDIISINAAAAVNSPLRNVSNVDAGFINYDSRINLIKDGTLVGKGLVGDYITYGFSVRNIGNTTLRDVHIIDSLISTNPIVVTPDSLLPGQSGYALVNYYLTSDDVRRGKVMNSATVYGTDPLDNVVTDISDNVNPYQPGPSDSTEVDLPKVDVSLRVNIPSQCSAAINDVITYYMIVGRTDTLSVTDVISIKDSLGAHLQFISANVTSGTYNVSSHIWSNIAVNNYDFDTLTIQARILTNMGGQMPLTAWLLTSTYGDVDSTPGNKITTEDDYASGFVSVPINICSVKNESVTLSAPAGHTTYQWQNNGVDIVGATDPTYTATIGGNYTVVVDGNTCSSGNCCPIIVQDQCDCKPVICTPFTITKTR
ncbi:MAG TPA: SdrD B-like domain-containing protein [Leadbetterella sp.]|nr:SdrD B-like domain-containing protein [Leadbetterella sp.]